MVTSVSPTAHKGDCSNVGGLIDVKEVAALCGCSTRHVRRLADAGKMPSPIKLGALLRWRRDAVESWIHNGCPAMRNVSPYREGRR